MVKKPRQTVSYVLEVADGRHEGHRLGVNGLAVDRERSILYSGGRDGRLCAWDLNLPLAQKSSVADHAPVALSPALSPPSSATTFRQQIQPHFAWVNDIALTLDDTALVSASTDLNVKLWRPHSETQRDDAHTLGQHTDYVKRLAAPAAGTPGHGQWIASGGLDRRVHLWDLEGKGSLLAVDTSADGVPQKGSVYALAVGPNMVAAGGPSRIVTLWDTRSGDKINHLIGHTDMIRAVLVDAAGETLLSASSDTTVKVWSTRTFKCLNTLHMHETSVWALGSADPGLREFYSADRGGLLAKTDIRGADEFLKGGECVAIGREDEGIVDLAFAGGHVWTATSRSSINRWADVGELGEGGGGSRARALSSSSSVSGGGRRPVRPPPTPLPPTSHLSLTMTPLCDRCEHGSAAVGTLRRPSSSGGAPGAGGGGKSGCQQGQPVRRAPEETVEGVNGVVRSRLLKDRRSVLTLDTAGEVVMWDIVQCRRVRSFGKAHVEDVVAAVDVQPLSTDSWCTVDTSSGSLVVTLNPNECFSAEVYLDEMEGLAEGVEFKEDQRVNLGKWVLRYLFANLVDTELRRDEDYRRSLHERRITPRPSLPSIRIPTGIGIEGGAGGVLARGVGGTSGGGKYTPLSPGITGVGTPGTSGLANILEGAAGQQQQQQQQASSAASRRPSQAALAATAGEGGDYFGGEAAVAAAAAAAAAALTPTTATEGAAAAKTPLSAHPLSAASHTLDEGGAADDRLDAADGADKTPSTPFTKFFSRPMAFGRKRSASIASEKRAAIVADALADKAATPVPPATTPGPPLPGTTQVVTSLIPPDAPEDVDAPPDALEFSFLSVVRRIRAEYDRQAREQPDRPLETCLSPASPADAPPLALPPAVKIVVREETDVALSNVYQGTVGSVGRDEDADVVERRVAAWLAELVLANAPSSPNKDADDKKVSFMLTPRPGSGVPVVAGPDGKAKTEPSPLTAFRMLRVRKVLTYVAERLGGVSVKRAPGAAAGGAGGGGGSLPRPDEFLELRCNGQRLEPLMTLQHIKKLIWKSPGDVELVYAVSDGWVCEFGGAQREKEKDKEKEQGARREEDGKVAGEGQLPPGGGEGEAPEGTEGGGALAGVTGAEAVGGLEAEGERKGDAQRERDGRENES